MGVLIIYTTEVVPIICSWWRLSGSLILIGGSAWSVHQWHTIWMLSHRFRSYEFRQLLLMNNLTP